VVVSSRRADNVAAAVRQLRGEGAEAAGVACHVGDPAQLQALVRFALDTYGAIDAVVSNAAVNPAGGPILQMEVAAIDKILDINGALTQTCASPAPARLGRPPT
jgi:dehydrogenase/reductase SDR family protein 4